MLTEAANARSPHIYLALTLALNAGMRDAELRGSPGRRLDSQRVISSWVRARPRQEKAAPFH